MSGWIQLAACILLLASIAQAQDTAPASQPTTTSAPATLPAVAKIATADEDNDSATPAGKGKAAIVNADDELAQYLQRASSLMQQKQYDQAIEILQTLINRNDAGFVATQREGQFAGLRQRASELLGQMDAAGLARYRALYDAQAQRLFEEAQAGDTAKLYLIVERYRNTTSGPKALDLLGSECFDRGRFASAAECWRQLLATADDTQRPMLLAKLAIVEHLAGHDDTAKSAADELRQKYPQASGAIGGRVQNLADFAAGFIAKPAAAPVAKANAEHVWPGVGGLGNPLAVLDDWPAIAPAQWVISLVEDNRGVLVPANYMALLRNGRLAQSVAGSHISLKVGVGRPTRFTLPPITQPIVLGDTVIYRTTVAVEAADMLTGKRLWRTENIPMVRRLDANPMRLPGMPAADGDRYALSYDGQTVYAVGNFRPLMYGQLVANLSKMDQYKGKLGDTSCLYAISPAQQGKILWQIGDGQGDDEIVRSGKFLSAPTCSEGRLLVQMHYMESCHVVCLDAAAGKLLWKTRIAQAPTSFEPGMMARYERRLPVTQAPPPTVADGRVFVSTESGAVAAVDLQTGSPIWAYQYSSTPRSLSPYGVRIQRAGLVRPEGQNQILQTNPILVLGSRLMAMPTDCDTVLCLSVADGLPAWPRQVSKMDQSQLSYIDRSRILLSSPGLYVLNVEDGRQLFAAASDHQERPLAIVGRPAVGRASVWASNDEGLVRLDLRNYTVQAFPAGQGPVGAVAPLTGNLVCMNGRLIASNSAGLCAFFDYNNARQEMTRRLESASPADKLAVLFQRSRLSFNSRQYAAALDDLLECNKTAASAKSDFTATVHTELLRAYVALGNIQSGAAMLKSFESAGQYAGTPQEKGEHLLRLLKYYRSQGDLPRAMGLAQKISEDFAGEPLQDVRIGAPTPGVADASNLTRSGREVGQQFIAEMLKESGGRKAYADFDRQAAEQMRLAQGKHDITALAAVGQRWPNSLCAGEAFYLAAAECYAQAQKQPAQAQGLLGAALQYLGSASSRGSAEPIQAAMALVYERLGDRQAAMIAALLLADKTQGTLEFGDFKGSPADLMARVSAARAGVAPSGGASLRTGLTPILSASAQFVCVPRGPGDAPIRVGDHVLTILDDRVVLLDTQAGNADDATAWKAISTIRPQSNRGAWPVLAGISDETTFEGRPTRVIVLADNDGACGIDAVSARLLWRKGPSELGVQSMAYKTVADGKLYINDSSGKLVCVDLAQGQVLWQLESPAEGYPVAAGTIVGDSLIGVFENGEANRFLVSWNWKTKTAGTKCKPRKPPLQWIPIGSDRLALLSGERLEVYAAADLSKPLWPSVRVPDRTARLLAATSDKLYLWCNHDKSVWAMNVADGKVAAKLSPSIKSSDDKAICRAASATIQGQRLYVFCAGDVPTYGTEDLMMVTGRPVIVAFDIATHKQLWATSLTDEDDLPATSILAQPPILAGDRLVCSLRALSGRNVQGYDVIVLDAATGARTDSLDLRQNDNGELTLGDSPVVVTNGRLLVETPEGLGLYGGQ